MQELSYEELLTALDEFRGGIFGTECRRKEVSNAGIRQHNENTQLNSNLVGGLEHFFFHILGILLPFDFHIFQRGRLKHQPGVFFVLQPRFRTHFVCIHLNVLFRSLYILHSLLIGSH